MALAEAYTKETGVPVTVVTAASGTYEQTLKSEMAKTEAPTLFQVNGPVGLASWKDYCYDLKDSAVYKDLSSDDFALIGDDGSVKGIAYVIETYGLIYNKKLLNDYIAMDGAVISSADDIKDFATLKAVAMTSRLRRTTWASPEHLLLPALTHPLTGDLKPTLPTCLCTMSIWQMASPPQMQ